MKKTLRDRYHHPSKQYAGTQHITIMLTLLIVSLNLVQLQAADTVFKGERISISFEGTSLKEALSVLEVKTPYRFFYNQLVIDASKKVNLRLTNASIKTVITELLKGFDITFKIRGDQIVLKKNRHQLASAERKPIPDDGKSSSAADVFPMVKKDNYVHYELTLSGKVVSDSDEPLPGVNVLLKGTTIGTVTDAEGKYTLSVPDVHAGGALIFSFIGFLTQEVPINGRSVIDIFLQTDVKTLSEVVVVSYGTQKRESVIGSITTIEPEKLKVPSSNLTTALAGRVAGIISYQRSGEPGVDNASFFIRGVTTFGYKKDPLILLDNNEITSRELARLQPDDIVSFSVMKDATATSLYGSRGANGVILVTTKRGLEGKATINIRAENSFSMPTQNIELADPITYMKLNNEAIQTRGLSGKGYGQYLYSQSKINHTMNGDNPYVYPANDWYKQTFKPYAQNKRLNFNLNGGDKVARYYLAGTINKDNGLLNVDKRNNFNSNIDLKSYLLRSNITINATKTTEVTVRLQGMFDDYQGPIGGGDAIYRQVMRTNPVRFPAYYLPDEANAYTKHIMFGNYGEIDPDSGVPHYNNPYASLTSGYRNYTTSQIMAQAELRQKLDFVLKGLAIRGLFNTNRYSNYEVRRFYSPFYYHAPQSRYNQETDTYILNALNPTTGGEALSYVEPTDRKLISSTTYMEAAINWDRIYSEKHAVSGLLVMTRREQLNANAGDLQKSLPYRNMSTAGRFTYAFDSRYFAEVNFGYNGSERFSKKERFGFFPSAGLAYIVSNEAFWNGRIKEIVNKLKFRGTYGLVGNDAIGDENDRFFYLSNVNLDNNDRGASFGTTASERLTGVSISRYANDLITWETATKLNVGIELNLLGKLEIQADVFSENRKNILMTRAANSTSGLQADVRANVGEARSHGFDMSASYDHTFSNGIWLTGMGNFTYATSKFTVVDEPDYSTTPWRSRVGTSLNQIWGLVAERLFVDDEEVRNSPKQFGEYMGGDIKYKDINRDGIINGQDVVAQGYPTVPEIVYGFGISAGKEGFDFSFFFQGLARESFQMNAFETSPFVNDENALLKAYADDHWSEENRNVYALWPRLSPTRVDNNMQGSTWVLRNGAFLRLKSVELGYTLPSKITSRVRMTNLRIYCSGTNLLTFSEFKLWDPELGGNRDANGNGMGYPIQKVYNIGVQLSF